MYNVTNLQSAVFIVSESEGCYFLDDCIASPSFSSEEILFCLSIIFCRFGEPSETGKTSCVSPSLVEYESESSLSLSLEQLSFLLTHASEVR